MTTPILLPPLPDFEGDTSPDIRDFNTKRITRDQLRARDLEVARRVLEAAAKEAARYHIGDLYDEDATGSEVASWLVVTILALRIDGNRDPEIQRNN